MAAVGVERDPDAGGDKHLLACYIKRCLQGHGDPLGHACSVARVTHVLEQHGELISAEPRDGVLAPDAAQQTLGGGEQQRVAGSVAEFVVDGLEVVHVEEQHRHAAFAGANHGVLEALGKQRPIGQLRQRIVKGLVLQLLVGGAQFAYAVECAIHVAAGQVADQQRRGGDCDGACQPDVLVGENSRHARGTQRRILGPHPPPACRPQPCRGAVQLGDKRQGQGQALEVERESGEDSQAAHDRQHGPIQLGDRTDQAHGQCERDDAPEQEAAHMLRAPAGHQAPPCVGHLRSGRLRGRPPGSGRSCRHRGQHRGMHGFEPDLVAAVSLNASQAGLRRFKQLLGGGVLSIHDHPTDAERDARLLDAVGNLERLLGGRAADALSHGLSLGQIGLGEQHGERATGQASRQIVLARGVVDGPRGTPQHGIACLMSVGSVELAQAVQVKQ